MAEREIDRYEFLPDKITTPNLLLRFLRGSKNAFVMYLRLDLGWERRSRLNGKKIIVSLVETDLDDSRVAKDISQRAWDRMMRAKRGDFS